MVKTKEQATMRHRGLFVGWNSLIQEQQSPRVKFLLFEIRSKSHQQIEHELDEVAGKGREIGEAV